MGLITQTAYQDWLGVPIIDLTQQYSVRFRAAYGKTGAPKLVILKVELYSPTQGSFGIASVAYNQLTANYQEFILPLTGASVCSDDSCRFAAKSLRGWDSST